MARKGRRVTAKAARPRATSGARSGIRAEAGQAAAGRAMTPSADAALAAAAEAAVELKERRPYTSRYPISEAEFVKLKSIAHRTKLAKGTATAAPDSGRKLEFAVAPGALRVADVAMAPAPAAQGAASFAGIAATGWIPPDCTMAVGRASCRER